MVLPREREDRGSSPRSGRRLTAPPSAALRSQLLAQGLSNKILAVARKQREEIEAEERQEEIGRCGPTGATGSSQRRARESEPPRVAERALRVHVAPHTCVER